MTAPPLPPHHRRQPPLVDPRRDVLRAVHDHARQHGRERRAAVDPARPARLDLRPRVDGQRLHADLRRPARHRRPPRRHLRPPPDVPLRRRRLRRCSSAFIGFSPRPTPGSIAGRAVQGIGAAFMMPATLSIITNAFPPQERGKAIGTWAGVSALALAIGPVVGGFLVENVSWQSIFFLNVPVAVVAVVVTLLADARVARRDGRRASVDVPGVADAHRRPRRARARARRGQPLGLGLARDHRPVRPAVARPRRLRRRRAPQRARRWSTSRFFRSRSFLGREHRRASSSRSRCSRCSSSSRSTCRTSGLLAAAGRRALPALDRW